MPACPGRCDQYGGSSGRQGCVGFRTDTRFRDAVYRVRRLHTSNRGAMEDTDLKWRKASYSSNGGAECVEVAGHDSRVLVRDTKNRTGPTLRFTPDAWRRFADQVMGERSLRLTSGRLCRGHSRV